MKKYNLLWHVFELEPRAHDFLDRYVQRIETYANKNLNKDILDDIKYNIIEKLYTASSPINEAFVMNLAETIGEPEQIFDNKDSQDEDPTTKTNLLERWFGKEKPMIWGVCYWIAKSLNIPVSIVRLIFLIAVFVYGTGLWLYPLLALFVPFKDKKITTGTTGNLFFEVIRVIIWLGVIFFLASALFGSLVGFTVLSILPTLSNQSLQAIVPTYLYPLAILALVSLVVLVIGSLGALIKKAWVSKTIAMIAIIIIIGSSITAGITWFATVSTYNYNPKTTDTQTLGTLITDQDTIIINLHSDQKLTKGNYFGDWFGEEFSNPGAFQSIELLPSENNEVRIEVADEFNILPTDKSDNIMNKRSQVITIATGNTIDITIPNNIFSQKVPFVFAQRTINISIPTDKKVIYNNNSNLRYGTPSTWYEYNNEEDYPNKAIYCNDKSSFTFYPEFKDWRCADTSFSEVNKDRGTDHYESSDLGDRIEDTIDIDLTPDYEDSIESTYIWLTLMQAQEKATANGVLLRVVEEDGRDLPRTEDYRPGRLNVEIRNGIIVDIDIE